jgi:general secretion pathway protein D
MIAAGAQMTDKRSTARRWLGGRLSRPGRAVVLLLALAMTIGACTGFRNYRKAQLAEEQGDWDQAVLQYLSLLDRDPGNLTYKSGLLRAKFKASQSHFEKAKEFHLAGALERAMLEYQQAVQLDPTNQYAQVELDKVRIEISSAREGESLLTLDDLKRRTQQSRPQPPMLSPREKDPISINFPKPVSVKDIYDAIAKAFGINILFDSKLRDQQLTIELSEVMAADALEMLMRTASHFYKVLDEHSIIVAEDNPQNRRIYEDLVIQTFFLSNADPKESMTLLRSLVGAKNIASNDQLNAIVLRDTADKVKVAERILMTNDKARGEVVIDVELLQIETNKLQELGVELSQYSVTQTLDPNPARVSDLEFINQQNWLLALPNFIYQFVKNSSDAQLLASPQVRISDGEKAAFHIGDRVPIPVTTFNTAQTVGGNIVPVTSFQYQDVGIRLDIEPRLHHNKEVTLKIKVEVSNLAGTVAGSQGASQPIIATRTIESTIRLKDGETNFLAGLLRSDETSNELGLPGLSEIPVLGRLFGKKRTENRRTDLVLTLTPHIIRTADITEEDLLPIWVGTEANITFRGGSPRVESEVEGPFDQEGDEEAERIREMIRRRIQNLPRGLREPAGEDAPDEEGLSGVQLVPPSAPRNPFDTDEDEEPPGGALMLVTAEEPVAAAAAANDQEPPPVRLELEASQPVVAPGDRFTVTLRVESTRPVSHLPVTLRFDRRLLEVESMDEGRFLGPEGVAKILAATRPGRMILGASRLGDVAGVTGAGVLVKVHFRALAEGDAVVAFEKGKALDPDLAPLRPLATRSARILISHEAAAASPTALGERPDQVP